MKVWPQADSAGYAPHVDDDKEGTAERPGLPERAVTVNMLVGYNMGRWRRAAGMTQEQVGAELGGWTKRAVSAAERSWDGEKVRQFDADLIASLASIYGVPIPAMFLPPPDDGDKVRYLVDGADLVPMEEYFQYLSAEPDLDAPGAAGAEYQRAVISAMAKYAGDQDREDVAEAVGDVVGAAQLEQVLSEVRGHAAQLSALYRLVDALVSDNALLQQALERAQRRQERQ